MKAKNPGSVASVEEVSIPAFSVFGGNCYVQHAGLAWTGEHILQYQTYVMLEGCNLRGPVELSYEFLTGRWKGLTSGSTAGKGDDVDKRVKRNAQMGGSWSKPDESLPRASDHASACTPMEDHEGKNEDG